jgi:hypothetical protein
MRALFKIKPLTEEEKAQKLEELRAKMTEKRARKAAEEAKEAKANELIRRKGGKVRACTGLLSTPTNRCLHTSTGNRADQRGSKEQAVSKGPRGKAPRFVSSHLPLPPSVVPPPSDVTNASSIEKEADKKAHAAIKAQIEADRRERAQKAAQEKALRDGTAAPAATTTTTTTSAPAPAAVPATSSLPGREFKETRLQIRLASGGQPLTTTLPSDSSCVPFTSFSDKMKFFLKSFPSSECFVFSSARGCGVRRWSEFDGGCRHRHVHSAVPSVRIPLTHPCNSFA